MVIIITLNPAIDYHMSLDQIKWGESNSSVEEYVQIGGKGINVGILLNNLETNSTLVGFLGGFTGNYISEELKSYPYIKNSMSNTKQLTRINLKLKALEETEINGVGKQVLDSDIEVFEKFLDTISNDDIVVITGRVASGMANNYYVSLTKKIRAKGANVVVDIATSELLDLLQYNPLLIKPNLAELGIIFNTTIKDESDLIKYGKKLIELGAINCIVSNGAKGSYLFTREEVLKANAPKGELVNSVGAGDSMVGGFVYEYLKNQDVKKAYQMAVAAGSASAFSQGIAKKELIEEIFEKVKIGG